MSEETPTESQALNQGAVISNMHMAIAVLNQAIAHTLMGNWPALEDSVGQAVLGLAQIKNQIHEALSGGIVIAPAGSERAAAEQMRRLNGQG